MSRRFEAVLLVLLVLLLAGGGFGRVLPRLDDHLLGLEYVDGYGTQWFYWFVEHQLRSGEGFGHSDLFFHPWGKDVYRHTGANVLDGLLALPFRWVLGPVLGFNLFVLAALGATAWATASFAHRLTGDHVAAALSGLALVTSPYVLFELIEGRPTQAILLFCVLALRFAWDAGERPGWRAPLLGGLMLALAGLQYWFYGFFVALAILAHGVARAIRPPEGAGGARGVILRHALLATVSLALVLPVAGPLLLEATATASVPGMLDTSAWALGSTPTVTRAGMQVGMFLWQPLRGITTFWVAPQDGPADVLAQIDVLPRTLLPVLALWLWRPGRLSRGPALAMAGIAALFAIGPVLLVGSLALPNPVYVGAAKALGFLARLWWPQRAFVVLAVLGALVVGVVAARTSGWSPRARAAALLGFASLWLLELHHKDLAPFPAWDATVPAGYRCLAEAEEGAVLELPLDWTQAHLYYQSHHQRPIFGGMLETNATFVPGEYWEMLGNRWMRNLADATGGPFSGTETWSARDRDAFHALGYRWVVVQKGAFVPSGDHLSPRFQQELDRRAERMRRLAGPPVWDDARIAIHAPWGDGSPCPGRAVEPDRQLVGRTDVPVTDRLRITDAERRALEPIRPDVAPPEVASP